MFEEILQELNRRKVKYLVVGGLAVNLHGFYRLTADLDIILLLQDGNIRNFVKAVKRLRLVPRIPVKIEDFAIAALRRVWIKDKNMKAFTFYDPGFQSKYLDVVIDHPINFSKAFRRRKIFRDRGLVVPVMDIANLIKMKKSAGRARDQLDIIGLKQIEELGRDQKEK